MIEFFDTTATIISVIRIKLYYCYYCYNSNSYCMFSQLLGS